MVTRPYDHAAHITKQLVAFQDQGSSSGTKVGRWYHPATVELDLVYGVVTDASAAATDTIVVYSGTTSIGGYAIGTATGTWTVAASELSTSTVAAGTAMSIATFGTGASDVSYVYHISPTNTAI